MQDKWDLEQSKQVDNKAKFNEHVHEIKWILEVFLRENMVTGRYDSLPQARSGLGGRVRAMNPLFEALMGQLYCFLFKS
jgi:hypothetical protein